MNHSLKNRFSVLILIFLSWAVFLFAEPAQWLKPGENFLMVLPPQIQEKDNVVYELSAAITTDNYCFELKVDNQSLDKITVDTGRDIFFNNTKPDLYTSRSEQITVFPNEVYQKELYFRKQKLRSGEKYQFKVNGVSFYLFYAENAPILKDLIAQNVSVLEYSPAGFFLRNKGSGSLVLINNSGENISRVLFVSGDDQERLDLKKLDYKHWYFATTNKFDEAAMLLIKANQPDYRVFALGKDTVNRYEVKPRTAGQYSLTVFPPTVKPAGEFEVRLHLLSAVDLVRATLQVFDESYALQPQKNNYWRCFVKLPLKTYSGRYPLKLYLKDADGVLVLTEEIEVL